MVNGYTNNTSLCKCLAAFYHHLWWTASYVHWEIYHIAPGKFVDDDVVESGWIKILAKESLANAQRFLIVITNLDGFSLVSCLQFPKHSPAIQ